MIVDGESRDLLDELEKVDGAVKEGRFEFTLQIDLRAVLLLLELVNELGNVDQGGDVHGKLAQDGGNDVPVPDVVLRALLGKLLNSL